MKKAKSIFLCVALLALFATLLFQRNTATANSQTQPAASKENAYRLNNIGVALLEQFKYKEAADAFRQALKVEPKLRQAQINLSIALFNLPDLPGATREAQTATALAPDAPQPPYILGLIAKSQSRAEDALMQFQRVLKIDPNDVGSNVNLGQIYSQQRKYPEAIAAFRVALAAEPYNATALYNLGQALVRSGQREEGLRATARFQELRQKGSATTLGNDYLEQGRYAEAVASTGAEAELVDRATPAVKFTLSPNSFSGPTNVASRSTTTTTTDPQSGFQLTEQIRSFITGSTVLFDFDGDGDLDLFRVTASQRFLYRNDNGSFTDITDQSTALSSKLTAGLTGVVAGDFDNDTKPDLFVIGNGTLALYHNDGGGKFSDVTKAANIPAYPFVASTAAFTDVDHDGDVDILIAGLADLSKKTGQNVFPDSFSGAPDLLLQNDGTGKFTDVTSASGLMAARHSLAVVPTDFNNRRDMDLLIVSHGTAPELFSNQRDGTFRNVARETGLPGDGRWTSVAAGDVNKDGYTDFFFGRVADAGLFAISDGKEKFKTVPAPSGTEFTGASQFLDYDNDGLLDCVLLTIKGLRVLRNVGNDWIDVTQTALGASASVTGISFSAGDIDNDGDTDLIVLSTEGNVIVLRNDGGNNNNSLRIALTGKVSNRNGIGTKVETRAGSLVQKLETSATTPAIAPADITFGLGKRTVVDAVRLLWPSGVVQAETEMQKSATGPIKLPITELDRKPSSCPYLYTWNGERFEFITDFMGGGEMGHLDAPGLFNKPDPVEYVRITSDQLKERDGAYEIRVTNELEEALFADRFQLIAVDHPSDVDVYPSEGLTEPPQPYKLFVTRHDHPPLTAIDEHGHDVLSRISKVDRLYPDDFRRDRIRGYAEEHTLTLKLGEPSDSHHPERVVLLLTGWTDYAWSSDNLAASQARKEMKLPALQVKDTQGKWQTVIDNIGIPVGRPQTVTVDLSGNFLSASREVRIVTNMRILWDQILVANFDEASSVQMSRLDPVHASLRWRGFSSEVTPDGREPYGYDYQRVSMLSPWKVMPGRYTREGDVRELLLQADDMFVISLPGDEISLSFDAKKLPPLRPKWTRTFLLYSDGFSKEMDINSASPDHVLPLPFHGMSGYPYPSREAYPMTPARQAYMDKYNTRVVRNETLSINSLIRK